MRLALNVNGARHDVEAQPNTPLLSVLRDDLGLTGTRYGCGRGQCGACFVIAGGRAVASCLLPVGDAARLDITTIEGLAQGDTLHPVQEAFCHEGAFQCGYCTSGMILATVALLKRKANPSDTEIVDWMNGHLCRCCGYPKIIDAIKRAAAIGGKL